MSPGYLGTPNLEQDEDTQPEQNSLERPMIYNDSCPYYDSCQFNIGDHNQQAGRDINQDITLSPQLYLQNLADVISKNQDIPEGQKGPIVNQLKRLSSNQWVQSIGTSVIIEGLKKLAGL